MEQEHKIYYGGDSDMVQLNVFLGRVYFIFFFREILDFQLPVAEVKLDDVREYGVEVSVETKQNNLGDCEKV